MAYSAKKQSIILIIEDSPDDWALMSSAISQSIPQIRAVWKTDSEGTIKFLDECINDYQPCPKLILLDLYLPQREHGLGLLETLKANTPVYGHPPIVVLSNSENEDDIQACYLVGCTSYLVKPTNFNQWIAHFQMLKRYWWDTVTVPKQLY